MKLPRPYIPWSIREQVIDRQMLADSFPASWAIKYAGSVEKRVRWKLKEFFNGHPVELHHRPALCNRHPTRVGGYIPDANDPDYLVYLPADEHDIETRVRGQHGDYSDLAKVRKRRRKEKKTTRRKIKWPSRKLRSRGF